MSQQTCGRLSLLGEVAPDGKEMAVATEHQALPSGLSGPSQDMVRLSLGLDLCLCVSFTYTRTHEILTSHRYDVMVSRPYCSMGRILHALGFCIL